MYKSQHSKKKKSKEKETLWYLHLQGKYVF